jgi:adenylosuccinate synthase
MQGLYYTRRRRAVSYEYTSGFGNFMRDKGKEFGATTGRPRRCGWFDAVMARESVMLNGISEMAIMKMDVLDGLDKVKICVAYKYKGKIIKEFPHDLEILSKAVPVYKEIPGWPGKGKMPRSFKDLHPNARAYLSELQDRLKAKITMVSIGSARTDTLFI